MSHQEGNSCASDTSKKTEFHADTKKAVNLTIDGIPVTVPEGTRILEAAKKVNVNIPVLCDHPDLCKRAVCRLCVVECDGRGKLIAACANDVWEGVSVVTNNERLMGIRKTIIELLLAHHPQDCLSCIRNTKCELQSLAEYFGIRTNPFSRDDLNTGGHLKEVSANTLTRDMAKCVKCGRCVEVCQEVQTVRAINTSHRSLNYQISTPYVQALSDGHCVFCGQCAAVCPVGAIYGHDQTAKVWAALTNSDRHVTAMIAPPVALAICAELGLPAGSITNGKIITALERLGFSAIYDAACFADMTVGEEKANLIEKLKTSKNLPVISCCMPGWFKFVKEFYPDLTEHLSSSKSPEQNFRAFVKEKNSHSKTTFVSIVPCIAKKYKAMPPGADESKDEEIVLTGRELAQMIRLAGIDLCCIPESSFAPPPEASEPSNCKTKTGSNNIEQVLWKVYEAYDPKKDQDDFIGNSNGTIREAVVDLNGAKVKALLAGDLGNARRIMDSIRKGDCDAALVGIIGCSLENACKINGVTRQ